ncbi:MAG: GH32 C-terminal domain-containing protein, partial [Mucilaginibacter sp.]
HTGTRWLDQGTDEYAGVTWNNTGNRRIFLGWMSNWLYRTSVPTDPWRSAMTIPQELKLMKVGNSYDVAAEPVKELGKIKKTPVDLGNIRVDGNFDLTTKVKKIGTQYELSFSTDQLKDFAVEISNEDNDRLVIGFDAKENAWYIDGTHAGESGFNKDFAKRIMAQRIAKGRQTDLTLIIDQASVELFADKGLTVMTSVFFPHKTYDKITVSSKDMTFGRLTYTPLKSIWP